MSRYKDIRVWPPERLLKVYNLLPEIVRSSSPVREAGAGRVDTKTLRKWFIIHEKKISPSVNKIESGDGENSNAFFVDERRFIGNLGFAKDQQHLKRGDVDNNDASSQLLFFTSIRGFCQTLSSIVQAQDLQAAGGLLVRRVEWEKIKDVVLTGLKTRLAAALRNVREPLLTFVSALPFPLEHEQEWAFVNQGGSKHQEKFWRSTLGKSFLCIDSARAEGVLNGVQCLALRQILVLRLAALQRQVNANKMGKTKDEEFELIPDPGHVPMCI